MIAEVVVSVNFEDGQRAVLTVSPSGWLSPSNADGVVCDANRWYQAAAVLTGQRFVGPEASASVRTAGGTAWPWVD